MRVPGSKLRPLGLAASVLPTTSHLADPTFLVLLILVVALRFPAVELCHVVHCMFV